MPGSFRTRVMLIAGVAHFALCLLIFPVTMGLTTSAVASSGAPDFAVRLLVRLTQLIHFPVITLALFPREWFPGNWVYAPMALNSVIWALGIYGLAVLFRKIS